jgi:hypothetical protein
MQGRLKRRRQPVQLSCTSIVIQIAAWVLLGTISVRAADRPTLLILPLDMVDTSGETPSRAQEHENRLLALARYLSKALDEEGDYAIVDPTPIGVAIDSARNIQPLSKCHGCERDLARLVDADRVLIGEIDKVSTLIGSLHLSIVSVVTGEHVFDRVFSFRGDTEEAWQHAARFFVRDLKAAAGQRL